MIVKTNCKTDGSFLSTTTGPCTWPATSPSPRSSRSGSSSPSPRAGSWPRCHHRTNHLVLSSTEPAVQGRVAEARTEIQSKARLMGVQLVEAKLAGEGGGGGEEEALKGCK